MCFIEGGYEMGPVAPKNPTNKRSCIYLMIDQLIQGIKRGNGVISDEIYLTDERLVNKASIVGNVQDPEILELLRSCSGFRTLVHSIGVSIQNVGNESTVRFGLMNYGKSNRYYGSRKEIDLKTTGEEQMLILDDVPWCEEDDVIGQFYFLFSQVDETASVTVRLFLNEGYDIPELAVDPPIDWDSKGYQHMIDRSLLQMGNPYRLQKAIEKAKRGEEVVLGFIGGSITQGAGAVPIHKECYAYKVFDAFRTTFCKDKKRCRLVKAGIGGTPSELGMIRYHKDIELNGMVEPDIVIVEFAVNDAGDETNGDCYESLVYNSLTSIAKPAVILLFSVFADDWNLQERLSVVGQAYELPMVSISDAVVDQFYLSKEEGKILTKRQFFYDMYHPSNEGHTIMADCVTHILQEAMELPMAVEDHKIPEYPVIGRSFGGIRFFDRRSNSNGAYTITPGSFIDTDRELQMVERDCNSYATPEFTWNWMNSTQLPHKPFELIIHCKSLLLIMKDSDHACYGKAEVIIDGICTKILDPLEVGWTHCNAVVLIREEKAMSHTVQIRMVPDDQGKRFTILGFGVVNE